MYKRKYNRGRMTTSYWIFGGIERVSKKRASSFIWAETLEVYRTWCDRWNQYVWPGIIVYIDAHRWYNQLSAKDYTLHVNNHSVKFVTQLPGVFYMYFADTNTRFNESVLDAEFLREIVEEIMSYDTNTAVIYSDDGSAKRWASKFIVQLNDTYLNKSWTWFFCMENIYFYLNKFFC